MLKVEAVPELMTQAADPTTKTSHIRRLATADGPVRLACQTPEVIGRQESHSGCVANHLPAQGIRVNIEDPTVSRIVETAMQQLESI